MRSVHTEQKDADDSDDLTESDLQYVVFIIISCGHVMMLVDFTNQTVSSVTDDKWTEP